MQTKKIFFFYQNWKPSRDGKVKQIFFRLFPKIHNFFKLNCLKKNFTTN